MSLCPPARRTVGLLVVSLVAGVTWQSPVATQEIPSTSGLATVWSIGGMVDDRNGDGVADTATASFVLGETPTADEVVAAAEVAARLGFETSALTLPLTKESADTRVVVGQSALTRLKLDVRPLELPRLAAGEGLVRVAVVDGVRHVLVLGGDGAGLQAAARVLAGRVPYVWTLGGATYANVQEDVERLLTSAKVVDATVEVPELHVRANNDGIERVVVVVRLSTLRDMTSAMFALQRVQMDRDRVNAANRLALSYAGVRGVSIRLGAPDSPSVNIDVPKANGATEAAGPAPNPSAQLKKDVDLSNLFTADGLLADVDGDQIPDGTDAALVPAGPGTEHTIDVAARLGLESTGIVVPLMRPASPEKVHADRTLLLIGTEHPLVDRLIEDGRMARPQLEPGEGVVQVVPRAFSEHAAVVVTGGDAAGLDRALEQVAERLPHIWERGQDRTTLDDIEDDVRRLIAARSPAGQAALGLEWLDRLLSRPRPAPADGVAVELAVEDPDPKLATYLESFVRERAKTGSVTAAVLPLGLTSAPALHVDGKPLDHEVTLSSEVDELNKIFTSVVLKGAKRGKPFRLEARISEPAPVRTAVAEDMRAQLLKKGLKAADTSITILSAHKQSYSWLVEEVGPALSGKPVDSVVISFADADSEGANGAGTGNRATDHDRWLNDLLPANEVLAKQLGVAPERVIIERMPGREKVTHRVVAKEAAGGVLLDRTFEVKTVRRPRLARFPDYEVGAVETGWVAATSDRRSLTDQRIATDIERFWEHFQSRALEPLHDYAVALHDGRPKLPGAPIFGTLTVDVSLSEPDEVLGDGSGAAAPLEALSHEIYSGTRRFFERVGEAAGFGHDQAVGHIVPMIRPAQDGKPGKVRVTATGFSAPRPQLRIRTETQGVVATEVIDLLPLAAERPSTTAIVVAAGKPGVMRLDLSMRVDGNHDDATVATRAPGDRQPSDMVSAAHVEAALAHLAQLRAAGAYSSALAYHHVSEIRVKALWSADDDVSGARLTSLLPNGVALPWPGIDASQEPGAVADTERKLSELASSSRAASLHAVGKSLLGRTVWALDLTSTVEGTHVSRAKQTTSKPTLLYTARERGTDRSSTGSLLKLAELLLTSPEHREKLEKVNVTLLPLANPDGAALADAQWQLTPTYIPTAGANGALGDDLAAWQWDEEARVPELAHKPRLWRSWRPDVVVSARGRPVRELTSLFGTTSTDPYAREGQPQWAASGWMMPTFSYFDDAGFARHRGAALALRERLAARLANTPSLTSARDRLRAPLARQSAAPGSPAPDAPPALDAIAPPTRGPRADVHATDVVARHPITTFWAGSSSVPDAGAQEAALDEAVDASLAFNLAVLDWLASQPRSVERQERVTSRGVWLRWYRARPAAPTSGTSPARATAAAVRE